MSDVNQFHDQLHDQFPDEFTPKKKMPDMLNVLTILTFIGAGWSIISAVISFATICGKVKDMNENANLVSGNGFAAQIMQSSADIIYRSCEMKVPLLIIGLVSGIACIAGAVLMRKLSIKGYYLYLVGEILGPVAAFLIFGLNMVTGFGLFFPLLFIILYSTQLKHLK